MQAGIFFCGWHQFFTRSIIGYLYMLDRISCHKLRMRYFLNTTFRDNCCGWRGPVPCSPHPKFTPDCFFIWGNFKYRTLFAASDPTHWLIAPYHCGCICLSPQTCLASHGGNLPLRPLPSSQR